MSLSWIPPVPRAPRSVPPCAGSSTTTLNPLCEFCADGEPTDVEVAPCPAGTVAACGTAALGCSAREGACRACVIIAPARNSEAMPQMVRGLGRWEFPTSSSIPNSRTDSRSLMGAVVTNFEVWQKRLAFSKGFRNRLPARWHFRCGDGLQVRLLQDGIRVGQVLVLKVGPPRQCFFCGLIPLFMS